MNGFNKEDFDKVLKDFYGEEVNISYDIDENTIKFRAEEEERAMLIGRNGRNINSVRELVRTYNRIHSSDYQVEVVE
ncbi:MAG: KH domain-containing protein [Candidatus Dojkabacteria bacterium]